MIKPEMKLELGGYRKKNEKTKEVVFNDFGDLPTKFRLSC
jgi:hypothetical protein